MTGRRRNGDERAAVPAVGKALEAAVLVLLVGLLSTALFGGVLPAYRTAAGAELADRTLAEAGAGVERAVPESRPRRLDRTVRVDLPETLRGRGYAVQATGRALVLEHPAGSIGGRIRPAVPGGVRLTGRWRSTEPTAVRVTANREGLRVALVGRRLGGSRS